MEEKIYRVINIYGKQEFCERLTGILQTQYDIYNLEKSLFYIDELTANDIRVGENEIFLYNHCHLEELDEEREILFFNEEYEQKTLNYFLRNPLDIFFCMNSLANRCILNEVVREYPFLLFTLVKENYRKYISYVGISSLLIENKIYPLQHVDIKIIEELFKNREYKLNYIYHFVLYSSVTIYIEYGNEENMIDKNERVFIESMMPYLYSAFEDIVFVQDIINKVVNDQQEFFLIEDVVSAFSDSELVDEYINEYKEKMLSKEKKVKYDIRAIISRKTLEDNEYERYFDTLDEYVMRNYYSKKKKERYISEFIQQELFENKRFLLEAAKKSFGLSKYSYQFNEDKEVIFEEIKHNCFPIYVLDNKFLRDIYFVLELREVCNRILFYVSEDLLNNCEFMLKYIIRYPVDRYFILGGKLSNDVDFLHKAIKYDVHILCHCSYKLRENIIFMQKAISINYYCIHFIGEKLKNNKAFLLSLSNILI